MPQPKRQRVRDPLHNLIEFDEGDPFERMLWRVVKTTSFQRLRRIRQLGFSDFVYPGATHSRFIHSLGVFHTARQLMRIVREGWEAVIRSSRKLRQCATTGPSSRAPGCTGRVIGVRRSSVVCPREEHVDERYRGQGRIAPTMSALPSPLHASKSESKA